MDDISEQFDRRDRFRRALNERKTVAERMAESKRLQARMWETLRASPEGWAHFLRRNFKARAVEVQFDESRPDADGK